MSDPGACLLELAEVALAGPDTNRAVDVACSILHEHLGAAGAIVIDREHGEASIRAAAGAVPAPEVLGTVAELGRRSLAIEAEDEDWAAVVQRPATDSGAAISAVVIPIAWGGDWQRFLVVLGEEGADVDERLLGYAGDVGRILRRAEDRVRVERRRSDERFQSVFESTPIPVAVSRMRDGMYIEANNAMRRMIGWSRDELHGRTASEIRLWADPERRAELMEEIVGKGYVRDRPIRIRTKGGEVVEVLVSIELVEREGEQVVVSMFTTTRHRVATAGGAADTGASEAQLRAVLEQSKAAITVWEPDRGYVVVNERMTEMLGVDEGSFLGRSPRDVFPEPLGSALDTDHRWVLDVGFSLQKEVEVQTPSGSRILQISVFPVAGGTGASTATSAGMIAIDVSAQRRAEHAAAADAERVQLLLESTGDGVFGLDVDGRCTFINRAAADMFGYAEDDLIGQHVHTLVHHHREDGTPYPWDECPSARTLQLGVPRREVREVLWRKDGTPLQVEYRSYPMIVSGDVVGAVVWFGDISGRRRWERELAEARDAALEASRLKSEFLATMSHEIRTPMNGVIGMTGLLLDSDLTHEQREFASTIRDSAQALLTIINDILDFSKIEAGRLDMEHIPFQPGPLLHEVAELLASQARHRGLDLRVHLEPDVPQWVIGDPGRLRQVVLNLAGNAVKFTDHGFVAIRAATESAPDGSLVRFEVEDTGVGIPLDLQPRLFDSFTQADASTTRRFGGTGLGLAISNRLVQLMGGELTVDSAPGRGSTFRFSLPLETGGVETGGAEQTSASGGAAPLAGAAGRRVLVVDDNPVNQRLASLLLERVGYRVDAVGDGAEAVAAVERVGYDAVVMDCQMPVMDGYQATAIIRRREAEIGDGRRLPIVALTAGAMKEDVSRALDAGMDAHVAKPIDRDELERVLAALLAHPPAGPSTTVAADEAASAAGDDLDGPIVAALERLREIDGDGSLMRQLVDVFAVEGPKNAARIAAGFASGVPSEIGAGAHSLKGSAPTFGADRVTELAVALEDQVRAGLAPDGDLVDELQQTMKATVERLVALARGE